MILGTVAVPLLVLLRCTRETSHEGPCYVPGFAVTGWAQLPHPPVSIILQGACWSCPFMYPSLQSSSRIIPPCHPLSSRFRPTPLPQGASFCSPSLPSSLAHNLGGLLSNLPLVAPMDFGLSLTWVLGIQHRTCMGRWHLGTQT